MMPIEREIRALERFECRGARALTLYVNTDPAREGGRNVGAQLDALLQPIWDGIAGDAEMTAALRRDVDTAQAQLLSLQPPPRAAALFVCTAPCLAYAVSLRFPTVPQATWDDHLHLKPLLSQLDEHERILVVLVDKQRLRLFRTFMGNIEEIAEFTDDVPGRYRHGGGYAQQKTAGAGRASIHMGYGSSNLQRHYDEVVHRHLDRALAAIKQAHNESPADHIMLAGTPEVRAEFIQLMPRRWRKLVRDDLEISTSASLPEVLSAVTALQEREERKTEEELVARVFELDAAHAAIGPAAVAEAVANREALTLIYAQDLQLAGRACGECGWFMPAPAPVTCGRCNGLTSEVSDLVDHCIERVLKSGGHVEEVRGGARARLEQVGGLAAVRRFMSSVRAPVSAEKS